MLLLGFSSLLCYFTILFLDLFLNPLLTDVLRSSRTWVYSCCSMTPWFSVSFEEVLSCICFFLVAITPLFWTVWMWSPTLGAVGCSRTICWFCLVTNLSQGFTSSCLQGCGWGKISRTCNVLRGNLYHIWQHYPVDVCQEYDWHHFLGSFSDLRCKFDMHSGKRVFQHFEEEYIPHIAELQVFTLLNWTPAIFTISVCLRWVIMASSFVVQLFMGTGN